jgi:HEAT repeat protein
MQASPDNSQHAAIRARSARVRGDIEALIEMLESADLQARVSATKQLGELGDRAAVPALTRLLNSRLELLRTGALKALAKIGDPATIPPLYAVATDDEAFVVRTAAMSALADLGDPRGSLLIAQALSDRSIPYRRWFEKWAAKRLVELKATHAVPDLEQARRVSDPINRWRLRRAIRNLRRL